MNAYIITLQLFERDDNISPWEPEQSKVRVVTVAKSLDLASNFVENSYKKADQTEKDFDWQVVAAEKIDGLVALPPFKKGISPKT
jgi:hypothetical protein